jgi:hypothetical protein
VSGAEQLVAQALRGSERPPLSGGHDRGHPFAGIRSACAIALHMHRPLIPAGGEDLRTAPLIGNLQYMFERPDIGENHNAAVFRWCYRRIGELIPELVDAGLRPRVMLAYSGTLLHGLRRMGADDVLNALRAITVDGRYLGAVEWLGCPWGHLGAPSTPVQDYALHVRAWQQHFAAQFGLEALGRVRSFSPSELALPTTRTWRTRSCARSCRPATAGCSSKSTRSSSPTGKARAIPISRMSCRARTLAASRPASSRWSSRKAATPSWSPQMQRYYEAQTLERATIDGRSVPPLVTQIADGETEE